MDKRRILLQKMKLIHRETLYQASRIDSPPSPKGRVFTNHLEGETNHLEWIVIPRANGIQKPNLQPSTMVSNYVSYKARYTEGL